MSGLTAVKKVGPWAAWLPLPARVAWVLGSVSLPRSSSRSPASQGRRLTQFDSGVVGWDLGPDWLFGDPNTVP